MLLRLGRCFSRGIILAALALAGCDNDPNPPPYHKTRADGTPWAVRYVALTADPRSFDPQVMYDAISQRAIEPVYDRLLDYHPLKTDPYEVTPAMLEAVPKRENQADGTVTYLCRLKPGILYHDDPCFPGGKGREVVAADVHYSFQRMVDTKNLSPFFEPLSQHIVGMLEARKSGMVDGKFDYNTPVSGIQVLDRYTFRIVLNGPFPQIKFWLACPAPAPVAREAVDYYDGLSHDGQIRPPFKFHPVGHGPFQMREYVPRQRLRYERFEGYHTNVFPSDGFPPEKAEFLAQFAGKPLPLYDELQFAILLENIPAFVLGRQGYLDQISANKDAFAAVVTADQKLTPKYRDRGLSLEKVITPNTFYISFNMLDPLIGKNAKLRQALSCAFDAQTYCDIFYSGVAPVAQQLVPRGLFGYDPGYRNPNGFNLERAKALLAEAGYPDGYDAQTGQQLVLSIEDAVEGSDLRQRAEFTKRSFEALGLKMRVSENTFARLTERQEQGDFQLASGSGWIADYPDPENFFFCFYSKNLPRGGANYSRYNRPEYDRAYEEMAKLDDGPERLALINRLNEMLAEDCPMILQFAKANYVAPQPWARWTHNNGMLEGSFQKYHYSEPVLRDRLRREWNRRPLWPGLVLAALLAGAIFYAVRWNRRDHV